MLKEHPWSEVVRQSLILKIYDEFGVKDDDTLKDRFQDVLRSFETAHNLKDISPIRDDILSEILKMKKDDSSILFSDVIEMLRLYSRKDFDKTLIISTRFTNPENQFEEIITQGITKTLYDAQPFE